MAQDRAGRTATSYDWADIEIDHPIDLAARQRIMAERMMISRFVLEGTLRYAIGTVGSDEFREETLVAGQTMSIPPFVPHGATALERTVVLDHFSPPSEKTGVDQG